MFEITKHVGGSDQIRGSSNADGAGVGETDHCQAAFCRNALAVKDLRHHCAAEHFVEFGESGGITAGEVAGSDCAVCLLRAGTENRRAGATTREIEDLDAVIANKVPGVVKS